MKRTYERILFMVIGALIASFGYIVGNADRNANAHEDSEKNIITCDILYATERVLVGPLSKGPKASLIANENNVQLNLFYDNGEGVTDSEHFISQFVSSTAALITTGGKDPNCSVAIGVSKDDVLGKKSVIVLRNDKNTHRITAHGSE